MTRAPLTVGCDAAAGHCITCSDEGISMDVVALTRDGAQCRGPDGVAAPVETELVGPVVPGDRLLVHAGVAIANLSRAAA